MFYLILAVIASACVSLFMRAGEKKIQNNMIMFSVNYLVCIILARLFMGKIQLITSAEGVGYAIGLGVIAGILYLGGFVLLQYNIQKNGVVLASVFMKLGVIIPTLMAMIVFREQPRVQQILGIIIAIIAIVVINLEKEEVDRKANKLWLLILLVCGGITDSMTNIYDKVGVADFKDHFLFYTFFVALICALVMSVVKKGKMSWWDALMGIAIGVPNYFTARFLLLSLGSVPAIIVYPVYSVATIAVVSLVSVVLFREKLGRQKMLAIGMILIALVLINI